MTTPRDADGYRTLLRAIRWNALGAVLDAVSMNPPPPHLMSAADQMATAVRNDLVAAGLDAESEDVRLAFLVGACTALVPLAETTDLTSLAASYGIVAVLVHAWRPR